VEGATPWWTSVVSETPGTTMEAIAVVFTVVAFMFYGTESVFELKVAPSKPSTVVPGMSTSTAGSFMLAVCSRALPDGVAPLSPRCFRRPTGGVSSPARTPHQPS
jgi:hypothetical protein